MANGRLLKLLPECFVLLVCLGFFGGLGIVLDKPSAEFRVVDFLTEHLFAAGGDEGLVFVGSHRLVLL